MYHSEWKDVKVVGTITCYSLFVTADNEIHTQHFLVPPPLLKSFQGNYASSTRRAMACFFSLRQQTFPPGGLPTEEAIKTGAITITRATKFIAMLRPLHINTKIHTCALNIFFVGKDMLQCRFERNSLENGNLICLG